VLCVEFRHLLGLRIGWGPQCHHQGCLPLSETRKSLYLLCGVLPRREPASLWGQPILVPREEVVLRGEGGSSPAMRLWPRKGQRGCLGSGARGPEGLAPPSCLAWLGVQAGRELTWVSLGGQVHCGLGPRDSFLPLLLSVSAARPPPCPAERYRKVQCPG
jgi:hypothetical protein